MIRPRTTAIRRPGLPLDEDDLMDQALEAEMGGGPTNTGVSGYGMPGGLDPGDPIVRPPSGGLGDSLRTVQTGPNSTMPVSDPSSPRVPSSPGAPAGGTGPAGTRRVPLSGRENQANLWGIHNSEVWENADSPDLNRRALRVLMRYPPTTEGTQQAMQDPDWLADPDLAAATYDGRDRLNFHGALSAGDSGVPVDEVDIMAAWENGQSQGYRWGDYNEAEGRNAGLAPTTRGGGPTADLTGDVQGGAIDMPEMNGEGGLDVPEIDPGNIDEILRMIRQLMDPRQQDALLGGALEEEFR